MKGHGAKQEEPVEWAELHCLWTPISVYLHPAGGDGDSHVIDLRGTSQGIKHRTGPPCPEEFTVQSLTTKEGE